MHSRRNYAGSAVAALALLALGLSALGLASCRKGLDLAPAKGPAEVDGIRLVVMIVVDQFPEDSLVRVEPALAGGLREMLDTGVVFTGAHHRHAATLTAPGHATISTGLDPRHSGIIENWWYSRAEKQRVSAVTDAKDGQSPRRLQGTTIGDWMKANDPLSKVFTASRKDRAAILLAGHRANAAFWLHDGVFVSSSYFPDRHPMWLDEFTRTHSVRRWFGRLWTPLPETMAGGLGIVEPDEGAFQRHFPHSSGDATVWPEGTFYSNLNNTPFTDDYLAEFAHALISNESLGVDDHMDFLGLSFSSLDGVGHEYGPESAEATDTILRLDRTLKDLFEFLDRKVGRKHYLVVLTADHGAEPRPEARWHEGLPAGRENAEDIVCAQRVLRKLDEKFGDADWFEAPDVFDRAVLKAHGVDEATITRFAADALAKCPQYFHVWTRQELSGPKPPPGPDAAAFWRSYDPERSADIIPMVKPWYVNVHTRGSTHGSPWDYDTHVPLMFWLPDRQGRTIGQGVSEADIAPTLATLLGLPRAKNMDGTDRAALVLGK